MGWLMRKICDHEAGRLAIETIDYNTETISCTKQDHRVICTLCGKVIVPYEHFDDIKRILTTGSTLQRLRVASYPNVRTTIKTKGGSMKLIEGLTVFSGKDAFPIDLTIYDEVRDETEEFPDHTEFTIGFLKDGKIVRRMWNPSCDIRYKGES